MGSGCLFCAVCSLLRVVVFFSTHLIKDHVSYQFIRSTNEMFVVDSQSVVPMIILCNLNHSLVVQWLNASRLELFFVFSYIVRAKIHIASALWAIILSIGTQLIVEFQPKRWTVCFGPGIHMGNDDFKANLLLNAKKIIIFWKEKNFDDSHVSGWNFQLLFFFFVNVPSINFQLIPHKQNPL